MAVAPAPGQGRNAAGKRKDLIATTNSSAMVQTDEMQKEAEAVDNEDEDVLVSDLVSGSCQQPLSDTYNAQ